MDSGYILKKDSICSRDSSQHFKAPTLLHDPQLSTFGDGKINVALQKKIAANSEAVIILEGVVDFLDKPASAFVRFRNRCGHYQNFGLFTWLEPGFSVA